jgi:class 3 adenylate cyclase
MVDPQASKRYLMAVVFLDLTGYTRLMAKSESRALSFLSELEGLLHEETPLFGGHVIKFGADGVFTAFNTGVSAVSFALKVQELIAARNAKKPKQDRFQVRLGIHLGDVMRKKAQLVGDAVNIATQIKPMAEPGGIAMTDTVYYQVKNQIALKGSFHSAGGADIPEHMSVFLVPPPGKSFFLWNLKQHAGRTAALVMVGLLAFSGTALYRERDTTQRMALMTLQTTPNEEDGRMAAALREELDQGFAGAPRVRWVSQEGVREMMARAPGAPAPEVLQAARAGGRG